MVASHEQNGERLKSIWAYLRSASVFEDMLNLQIQKAGLLPADLARSLFVDASTVSYWRRGRRIPQDASVVFKIAKALDLTPISTRHLYVAWSVQKQLSDLALFVEAIFNDEACTEEMIQVVVDHLFALHDALDA